MTGELVQNCKSCTGKDKLKQQWGCETDAPVDVFEIHCVRCYGRDIKCPVCKGTGKEQFYRCPVKLLTPDTIEFLKYYRFFCDGLLPVSGGLIEQSVKFIDAVGVVNRELQEHEGKK